MRFARTCYLRKGPDERCKEAQMVSNRRVLGLGSVFHLPTQTSARAERNGFLGRHPPRSLPPSLPLSFLPTPPPASNRSLLDQDVCAKGAHPAARWLNALDSYAAVHGPLRASASLPPPGLQRRSWSRDILVLQHRTKTRVVCVP